MKELEGSEFEQQWKGALGEAEASPAPHVWSNLDRELTLAEGNEIKKRMVFYQRLAAACVLFALMAGSFGVYHWQRSDKQIAQSDLKTKSTDEIQNNQQPHGNVIASDKKTGEELNGSNSENVNAIARGENESNSTVKDVQGMNQLEIRTQEKNEVNQASNSVKDFQRTNTSKGNTFLSKTETVVLEAEGEKGNANDTKISPAMEELTSQRNEEKYATNFNADLALLPTDSLHGSPTFVEIVRRLPAIPSAFMMQIKKSNFNHEKLWASVIAASGVYSDNNKGSSPYALTSPSNSSSLPTGNSYTVGMLGGVRVAKRWVLQSGVQYMNQSAGYSSNISSTTLDKIALFASNPGALSNNVGSSATYDITSTNQFLTVPVQVGYLLVDKKIGWQINPGFATDFFVRNTLSDPSGLRQSYSQGAGADSPYRSVNFSGLMSTEVSYKVGKSYRLSLVPGFKYSFNPVLKSQTTGNPLVWDVGFRFRYIFK